MAELGYVNIFAQDVVKLAGFYADVFGFEEIIASRSPIFGGLKTGKSQYRIQCPRRLRAAQSAEVFGRHWDQGVYDLRRR